MVEDRTVTEHLTADTFFVALRIGQLTPSVAVRDWLVAIARDTVEEHLLSVRERQAHGSTAAPPTVCGPTPYQRNSPDHDATMVRGLIRDLSEDQRRCLELHYLHGLDLVEIAARMDRPLKTVAVLHMRAIRQLRRLIGSG